MTRAAFKGIVDTVRNRLLDFVLKIEAKNPSAGEGLSSTQPVPDEKLPQVVLNLLRFRMTKSGVKSLMISGSQANTFG